MLRIGTLVACLIGIHSVLLSQDAETQPSGQLDHKIWQLKVQFSEKEFKALQPAALGFGGANQGQRANQRDTEREKVRNLLGIEFPWVKATIDFAMGKSKKSRLPCRIRYDGDFTYTMAGQSPKRPMYVELLDGHKIVGASSFRLHTMQFDPTMLRERVGSHVYTSFKANATRSTHAELSFVVGDKEAEHIGLYTVLESVDGNFLKQKGIQESSLLIRTRGLTTIQYLGNDWNAYGRLFRTNRVPNEKQKARIIEFARLIDNASDDEFHSSIQEFVDVEKLLRYVAASSATSNLTGMASIGANDFLCLDGNGKFHVIASEMEIALGGSVLCGTPEELANLRLKRPYAGECKLVDRILANNANHELYLKIVREGLTGFFNPDQMSKTIGSIERASVKARERETQTAQERLRRLSGQGGGGFAPPTGGPQVMDAKAFIVKRVASIKKQLKGIEHGYSPRVPNLTGFGGGGRNRRRSANAPISEAQFRQSVKVPDEFNVTLFARSPEVNYPVAIAAEPHHAIYVASDEQGSLGTDPNGGKVLRCVDEDGDGKMDKVTTFCRVDHVRGVVYRNGAVWVSHPPYLSVFHDDDGDGVADRKKRLVSGLTTDLVNTRGGDHTTNGVRMGIDGWLYIGDGDYGVPEAKGVDGSTVVLRGGGILRVRPDGTELELFASGLRNPFDVAIDPQLNMFTRDNTNDGGGWDTRVSQLFQTAEYGYPRLFANFSDEIMPTLGTYGNGGGTGSLYIEDESWPEGLNRSLFTGDWGRSGVFHHPLKPNEATFETTQNNFATIPRATGMDLDARGNLYVASWWSGEASVYVGPQVGFVTRLTPKGAEQRKMMPDLKSASITDLIDRLRSPNAVVRFHVQGELIQRSSSVIKSLTKVCKDREFPISGRIAALFALKQIRGAKSHKLLVAMTEDPSLREFAIRALTDRKSQLKGLDPRFFEKFLADKSPRVRSQALISLGRLGDSRVAKRIIPLAMQSGQHLPDPSKPDAAQVVPHLALRALIELDATNECLKALNGPYRQAALRALRYMHNETAVEGLIQSLESERDINKRNEILTTLIRLYQHESPYDGSWWGIRPDTTGPHYDPMEWAESKRVARVLVSAIQTSDADTVKLLRKELERHQVELPGVKSLAKKDPEAESQSIIIQPVDPSNPNQLGNMGYESILTKALAAKGDAKAGAAIFKARSCAACHTSAAGQKPAGPHLADIGKRYKSNELIESILKPSEKIAQGYETQLFSLDSGKNVSGFVVSEKGKEITLRDSQGKTHRILREQIEQRKRSKNSAMPTGLAGSMTVEELANLIAYLKSL